MRAAEQVDDTVLSLGFRNMARAWLDLGKKNSAHLVEGESLRRQQSNCHTKSRRRTGGSRATSRMKRPAKSPSRMAAKHAH